jgi:hypothetical protein
MENIPYGTPIIKNNRKPIPLVGRDLHRIASCGRIDEGRRILEKYEFVPNNTIHYDNSKEIQNNLNLFGLRTIQLHRPDVGEWLVKEGIVEYKTMKNYKDGINSLN